jgi:hypothetical protein
MDGQTAADDGRGHFRASHADRERVVGTLTAAYVYGLVTKDEFDERVGRTLAARTYAELAVVTADIPPGLAPAPPPLRPVPAKVNAPAPAPAKLGPGQRAAVATAVLAGLALIAAVFAADLAADAVAVLLGLGATGSALLSMFLAAAHIVSSRRDKGSGGRLPPQAAISTGRSAAQLPHTSQPRRQSPADAARRHSLRPQLSS